MKRLLFLLSLIFLPVPAKAITWNQFWAPFTYGRPYYYPRTYYVPMCNRLIYHEEYISGDYSGYVRRWSEWVRVPCDVTY